MNIIDERSCDLRHDALDQRVARIEEDDRSQWNMINDLKKTIQKLSVQIALIVGTVSTIIQVASMIIQYGVNK